MPECTFIRFLFRGETGAKLESEFDQDIIAAERLDYAETLACGDQHRTPMVLQWIDDARTNPGIPLDVPSPEFA